MPKKKTASTALAARMHTHGEQPVLCSVDDRERGDVPGWVLITLMTAGLVVLLWAVAGPALTALFEQALSRVNGL